MAVAISAPKIDAARGVYYEIDLSASGDVAQAHLVPNQTRAPLDWLRGYVSWWRSASVTPTFTNAGADAMAITGGNGELDGWVAHPNSANSEASETLPITGLRFAATAADQKVILYTGQSLADGPVDAGTPA